MPNDLLNLARDVSMAAAAVCWLACLGVAIGWLAWWWFHHGPNTEGK